MSEVAIAYFRPYTLALFQVPMFRPGFQCSFLFEGEGKGILSHGSGWDCGVTNGPEAWKCIKSMTSSGR